MRMGKLNTRLLQRIKKHILEDPRRYIMDWWILKYSKREIREDETLPSCGTAACIAGWANLLTNARHPLNVGRAIKQLGLSFEESDKLFLVPKWPSRFRRRFNGAVSPKGRARVAAQYIDYVCKNGFEEE